MNKFFGILIVLVIGYFFFFKESNPDVIFYHGLEYGPSTLDRSNDSNSKIYNYSSKSVSNKDYISVLYPDANTGTLVEWLNMFSAHFEKQGFRFTSNGPNKIGVNNDVTIFMMPSENKGVMFMYVLENNKNYEHIDIDNVFTHLESIVLE